MQKLRAACIFQLYQFFVAICCSLLIFHFFLPEGVFAVTFFSHTTGSFSASLQSRSGSLSSHSAQDCQWSIQPGMRWQEEPRAPFDGPAGKKGAKKSPPPASTVPPKPVPKDAAPRPTAVCKVQDAFHPLTVYNLGLRRRGSTSLGRHPPTSAGAQVQLVGAFSFFLLHAKLRWVSWRN